MMATMTQNSTMFKSVAPQFATYVSNLLPCASMFIKPAGVKSSAYGIFEAAVLIHAAMEIPPNWQLDMMTATDWEDIDVTLVPLYQTLSEPGLSWVQSKIIDDNSDDDQC